MAVDEIDLSLLHRAQSWPRWIFREQVQVANGLRDLESAGHENNDFRVGLDQRRPIEPVRMFAGVGEQSAAAGHFDKLGHPIPARH